MTKKELDKIINYELYLDKLLCGYNNYIIKITKVSENENLTFISVLIECKAFYKIEYKKILNFAFYNKFKLYSNEKEFEVGDDFDEIFENFKNEFKGFITDINNKIGF